MVLFNLEFEAVFVLKDEANRASHRRRGSLLVLRRTLEHCNFLIFQHKEMRQAFSFSLCRTLLTFPVVVRGEKKVEPKKEREENSQFMSALRVSAIKRLY